MSGYWGATADPNYGYSPYSGQLHYVQHQYSSEPFTPPPGEGNSLTIEEIEMRINNVHPEVISALADQWQNAWTLMSNIRTYVLLQSNVLHDEHWNSPRARDEFLKRGPGEALAYLDVWMEAAQKNVTVLRHLVHIAQNARDEMARLMREYETAIQKAKDDVGWGSQMGEFWSNGIFTTWDDAGKIQAEEQINEKRDEFTRRAQELAFRVGDQHFDYTGQLSAGMGPPFRPMDAVLNAPGAPPMPALPPGVPGGVPSAPPPPVPLNALNAPPPPAPPAAVPPPVPVLPPGAVPPPAPPAGVPGLPPGAVPPPLPTAFNTALPTPPPNLGNRVGVPPPGGLPSGTQPPGTAPGSLPTAAPRPPANPGQLTKNAFNRNAGGLPPGAAPPPGRTLRRPDGTGGTPGQPGRGLPAQPGGGQRRGTGPPQLPGAGQPGRPGATQPGRPGAGQPGRPGDRRTAGGPPQLPGAGQPGRSGDRRATGGDRVPGAPIDSQEAFGRPPAPTAPPVLKNPAGDRSRQRPGSPAELRAGDGSTRKDGTAPPVLNRPNRTAETNPPPGRARPGPERGTPPNLDWVGADEARAEAGAPVLDAPAPPPSGRGVSRLEEVPKNLRSRAAQQPATGPPARPGTVAPELSKRRTGDEQRQQRPVDEEAPGVISDERAFEVRTPGGAVVTSQRDETYEPEVRRALGGGR